EPIIKAIAVKIRENSGGTNQGAPATSKSVTNVETAEHEPTIKAATAPVLAALFQKNPPNHVTRKAGPITAIDIFIISNIQLALFKSKIHAAIHITSIAHLVTFIISSLVISLFFNFGPIIFPYKSLPIAADETINCVLAVD